MGLVKQSKVLNKPQIEMVSTYLRSKRNGLRNQTIFLLSVKCGLRAKEISQLSWKEVCNSDGEVDNQVIGCISYSSIFLKSDSSISGYLPAFNSV